MERRYLRATHRNQDSRVSQIAGDGGHARAAMRRLKVNFDFEEAGETLTVFPPSRTEALRGRGDRQYLSSENPTSIFAAFKFKSARLDFIFYSLPLLSLFFFCSGHIVEIMINVADQHFIPYDIPDVIFTPNTERLEFIYSDILLS